MNSIVERLQQHDQHFQHFQRLKRAKIDYLDDKSLTFQQWLIDQWGLRIHTDTVVGGYTDNFTVVDEKKYLMYLLKFG